MIKGEKKKKLDIDSVMMFLSSFDIYRFYMPDKTWRVNQATHSPFRKDASPSFMIGSKNGELHHIDFAAAHEYRGDCFDFVRQMYGISLPEALRKIDQDFGLGISLPSQLDYRQITSSYEQPEDIKRYCLIQATVRPLTLEELAYWNLYHISREELRENSVYGIRKLYLNRQRVTLKETELHFGYFYEGHWKIYSPFAERKYKWMPNNVPITAMDGREHIKNCDTAFINKSKKDFMVVRKLFPCSCAVQNESVACFSKENVQFIKENSRRQILSFDADDPGVANSLKVTELFGFDYCNVPRRYLAEGIKDWADLARAHGMEEVEKCLMEKNLLSPPGERAYKLIA